MAATAGHILDAEALGNFREVLGEESVLVAQSERDRFRDPYCTRLWSTADMEISWSPLQTTAGDPNWETALIAG